MAGITLAQAEIKLAEYLAAETRILAGQKTEIEGRALTRANLAEVRDGVAIWDERVKTLSARAAGGRRNRTMVPGW